MSTTNPLTQATQDLISKAGDDELAAQTAIANQTQAQGALAQAQTAANAADGAVNAAQVQAKQSAHDAIISVAKDLGFSLPPGF